MPYALLMRDATFTNRLAKLLLTSHRLVCLSDLKFIKSLIASCNHSSLFCSTFNVVVMHNFEGALKSKLERN